MEERMSTPLRPLAPPRGSPAWIFKEPKEFYAQQERAVEREARKTLRLTYRNALKEMGYPVALHRPTVISTLESDPPARIEQPSLSTLWAPPPYIDVRDRPKKSPVAKKAPRAIRPSDSNSQLEIEDNRATICGEKSKMRKEMFNTLKGWGRCVGGNPWTLKQVYAEIECDIAHKKAPDTRAKRGKMGANEIGRGATVERRDMVKFERQFGVPGFTPGSTSDAFGSGETVGTGGSNSVSSTLRSAHSLPALTLNPHATF